MAEHVLQIIGEVDFTKAKQQAAQFRQEQEKQPVSMGGPSAQGVGVGAQQTLAMQAAAQAAAVRSQQASSDARSAAVPSAASMVALQQPGAHIERFLARAAELNPQIAGSLSSQDFLAYARTNYPKDYGAAMRGDIAQSREADRTMSRESSRQNRMERYGESRDMAYENRQAGDRFKEDNADRQEIAAAQLKFRRARAGIEDDEDRAFERGGRSGATIADRVSQYTRRESLGASYAAGEERLNAGIRSAADDEISMAAMRESAADAEKRGASAEDEEGQGGGARGGSSYNSRLFGLRMGRLGQYATVGFLALEGSRIAMAATKRNEDVILAGGNQQKILSAEQQYQEAITATPIVGPLTGYLADQFGASRVGTSAILQSANAQDQQGAQIAKSVDYGRQLSAAAQIATTVSPFGKQRAEFEEQRRQGLLANQQIYTETGSANTAKFQADQASNDATLNDRAQREYRQQSDDFKKLGMAPISPASAIPGITQSIRDDDANAIAAARKKAADDLEAARKANDAAVQTAVKAKIDALDRATDRDTQYNNAIINNDRFGGERDKILNENKDALNGVTDPVEIARITLNNTSRLGSLYGETDRSLYSEARDYSADTSARQFEETGDRLGAARERIKREQEKAQDAVPKTQDWAEQNARAKIDENAAEQSRQAERDDTLERDRVRQSLATQVETSGFQAQGRPYGAQAKGIEDNAVNAAQQMRKAAGVKPSGFIGPPTAVQSDAIRNSNSILQVGINEELAMQRQLQMGGQAGQVQGGSFAPGSGEGGPQLENIANLIQELSGYVQQMSGAISGSP